MAKVRIGDIVAGPCPGDLWLVLSHNKIMRIRGSDIDNWSQDNFGIQLGASSNHNWLESFNFKVIINLFDLLKKVEIVFP